MTIRIGQGFDVHAFANEGDHIILAGVTIPHSAGLKAHSDGDVVLHALCDALLGALALGDIGQHFPDSDNKFANIDSSVLLTTVYQLVSKRGYSLVNADITIAAEAPKLAPYVAAMRTTVAEILGVAVEDISIKATTTEKLGFVGRREGIAVLATVLISNTADQ